MQPYNYNGIRTYNLSSIGSSGSHRDLSDDELYQRYGTYKTYRYNQGKKVFYKCLSLNYIAYKFFDKSL